jgi:predicted AAA+ superfamily ATPase
MLFPIGKTDKKQYICHGKTDKSMIDRQIEARIEQFYKSTNKALLLTGARQTGKTFSIRKYGKSHFKSFIEINFIENKDVTDMFSGANSAEDILLRISAIADQPIIKGETLIFFDEVQVCPEIVTAIKFLVDEGSYRYILSGSMLGVELKDIRSVPVGYMGIMNMYPLNFEEFVASLGVGRKVIDNLRQCWRKKEAVDSFIHKKMMELFRLYLIVGGMPAVVQKYIDSNNLQLTLAEQRDIVTLYKRDISQYNPQKKLYIEEIFDLIPSELNAKNKRFILKDLNENVKFSRYNNSFLWLKDAGVALPVYNVEEPKAPLTLSSLRSLFKLFMSDIGLLASLYANGLQIRILKGDDGDINFGAIYENAVAQELCAHGFELYYFNSKKQGEVDFLIEKGGRVFPIEVKSGKDYERHRALSNIMQNTDYQLQEACVLCNDNMKVVGNIVYAPIYMTMFIEKSQEELPVYKFDTTGL